MSVRLGCWQLVDALLRLMSYLDRIQNSQWYYCRTKFSSLTQWDVWFQSFEAWDNNVKSFKNDLLGHKSHKTHTTNGCCIEWCNLNGTTASKVTWSNEMRRRIFTPQNILSFEKWLNDFHHFQSQTQFFTRALDGYAFRLFYLIKNWK